MANAIYPKFKENLLKGNIDFDVHPLRAYLVDLADYTYSAAHELIASVPVIARVATATLGSVTTVNGTLDAANFAFTAVTGDTSEALIFTVVNGGNEYLVAFYDAGVTGLPVIPNGGDINITINVAGLFDL